MCFIILLNGCTFVKGDPPNYYGEFEIEGKIVNMKMTNCVKMGLCQSNISYHDSLWFELSISKSIVILENVSHIIFPPEMKNHKLWVSVDFGFMMNGTFLPIPTFSNSTNGWKIGDMMNTSLYKYGPDFSFHGSYYYIIILPKNSMNFFKEIKSNKGPNYIFLIIVIIVLLPIIFISYIIYLKRKKQPR